MLSASCPSSNSGSVAGGPPGALCVIGNMGKSMGSMGSEDDVLDDNDVVVPADLPLEAIAEEVQNSWHLKVAFHHSALLP